MRDLRGLFVLALLAGGLPPTAWGAPYWVAYEGDVFPEEDGWERIVFDDTGANPPGADRTVAGGVLTIDSRRSPDFVDFYKIDRNINPSSGETFIAEWRAQVSSLQSPFGLSDVEVVIAPDQMGTLGFALFPDAIRSVREGWSLSLEPGLFHEFRVVSGDMVEYDLFIDGSYARSGVFDLNSINQSFVGFGDVAQGANVLSNSEWDYVRFGVVPEPSTSLLMLVAIGFRSAIWVGLRRCVVETCA